MNRDELIARFMPMAEKTVSSLLWRSPHFSGIREDLVSVAYLKLINSVDRYLEKNEDNLAHLANYIRISIVTGISDFVRDNSTIRAPKNKWVATSYLTGDTIDARTLSDGGAIERLENACRTPTERTVLAMSVNGSTRKEIASYLCLSQKAVRQIAGGILERAKNG